MFLAMKYLKEGELLQKRALGVSTLCRTSLYLVLSFLVPIFLLVGCTTLLWGTPQAAFTNTPGLCYCHQQMTFDASGCSSEKDEIVSYSWNFGGDASANGTKVKHTFNNPGDYAVRLTITTEHGQEASVTHTVHVVAGLVVPVVYPTIQAAIDAAKDGDVVIVLAGKYQESINFKGKGITVQSTDPDAPAVVDATMIEGVDPGFSIVSFARGETRAATLAGFTIKGGQEYGPCCGGGIYVREASPTIRNNRIINHIGGAIYLVESGAKLINNVISNNKSAEPGGAIVVTCYTIAPVIIGNTFSNNTAPFGGAIYITADTTDPDPATAAPTIVTDNTFTANIAKGSGTAPPGGGAIFVEYWGNLRLDTPDSNTYSGNDPNDIFYTVPPSE